MGINKEMWLSTIQEAFTSNVEFLNEAGIEDHSAFFENGVINVPVAGAGLGTIKNATSFPLTPGKRTDTNLTYSPDTYSFVPVHIQNWEEFRVNYAKQGSVIKQQVTNATVEVAFGALQNWAEPCQGSAGIVSRNIIMTTGSTSGLNLAPSATGTRKMASAADFALAKRYFDLKNIPATNRIAVCDPDMLGEVLDTIKDADKFGSVTMVNGQVDRLYGFKVISKTGFNVYDGTSLEIKDQTDAGAAGDKKSCFFFHAPSVAKCQPKGGLGYEITAEKETVLYNGYLMGGYLLFGAKLLRADGVLSLVQG